MDRCSPMAFCKKWRTKRLYSVDEINYCLIFDGATVLRFKTLRKGFLPAIARVAFGPQKR